MNPFDIWDKSCELCGKGAAVFTIDKQLHGEYRRYHVCQKCKDQHDRDLELCRSNFQAQFGEPTIKKNTYNWIKVEDGLPEPNTYVILYTDRGLTFVGALDKDNEWYEGNPTQSYGCHVFEEWLGKVTHWMPFPDDPV